jgi:hypothetical protein
MAKEPGTYISPASARMKQRNIDFDSSPVSKKVFATYHSQKQIYDQKLFKNSVQKPDEI